MIERELVQFDDFGYNEQMYGQYGYAQPSVEPNIVERYAEPIQNLSPSEILHEELYLARPAVDYTTPIRVVTVENQTQINTPTFFQRQIDLLKDLKIANLQIKPEADYQPLWIANAANNVQEFIEQKNQEPYNDKLEWIAQAENDNFGIIGITGDRYLQSIRDYMAENNEDYSQRGQLPIRIGTTLEQQKEYIKEDANKATFPEDNMTSDDPTPEPEQPNKNTISDLYKEHKTAVWVGVGIVGVAIVISLVV